MKFKTESEQRLENEWGNAKLAPMVKSIVNEANKGNQ